MGGGNFDIKPRIQFIHAYHDIISVENLLLAWKEFVRGKRKKKDVELFQLHLMDNVLDLYADLKNRTYGHGGYHAFNINDPKPRNIHKASVRDRLLHHAIYHSLYPFFDRTFIADSYSCRFGKGTHRAIRRFKVFSLKVSRNNTRQCHVLKCDVRKFFASIDHGTLLEILRKYIADADVLWLLERVVSSFYSREVGVGLPLGNLTSQLLVNIYMNEFDQFMKHKVKARCYVRYADDFVILDSDKDRLERMVPAIEDFLRTKLKLALHPDKVFIKTLASGVDFLGWVHFPDHRVMRTVTRKRMFRNIKKSQKQESIQSYLGLLTHGNAHKLRSKIKEKAIELDI